MVPKTKLPSAPTSDPAEICRQVKAAIARKDRHDARLLGWSASMLAFVSAWEADGSLDPTDAQDLTFMLTQGDFDLWHPILYIIPRASIDPGRLKLVPPDKRAGYGREYIIEDLTGAEFEPLEL